MWCVFPTEVENVNYAVERTFTGFGAAIVKAITGQQSNEPRVALNELHAAAIE
jgi:hypothetical protein